jgi:hypothetical protein
MIATGVSLFIANAHMISYTSLRSAAALLLDFDTAH